MQAVDYYSLPTLIYLMCVMSSMSFVMSTNVFMFRVLQGKYTDINRLGRNIFVGQVFAFLAVTIFSLCVGFYHYGVNGGQIRVGGEVLILACALLFAGFRARRSGRTSSVLLDVKAFIYFMSMCAAGWAVTFGVGISLFRLLMFLSIHFGGGVSPIIWAVFISGLLWNVPALVMYRMIRIRHGHENVLPNVRFHKVLWPVLCAYMVLLCPLMIEKQVNSPEWRERQNVRPVRSI